AGFGAAPVGAGVPGPGTGSGLPGCGCGPGAGPGGGFGAGVGVGSSPGPPGAPGAAATAACGFALPFASGTFRGAAGAVPFAPASLAPEPVPPGIGAGVLTAPFGIGSGCPGVGSGTFGGSGSPGRFDGSGTPAVPSGLPA